MKVAEEFIRALYAIRDAIKGENGNDGGSNSGGGSSNEENFSLNIKSEHEPVGLTYLQGDINDIYLFDKSKTFVENLNLADAKYDAFSGNEFLYFVYNENEVSLDDLSKVIVYISPNGNRICIDFGNSNNEKYEIRNIEYSGKTFNYIVYNDNK